MKYQEAVQLIAAGELRISVFEATIANGTPAEDVEFAIRDTRGGVLSLRREFGIEGEPAITVDDAQDASWETTKAALDALQAQDPESPSNVAYSSAYWAASSRGRTLDPSIVWHEYLDR